MVPMITINKPKLKTINEYMELWKKKDPILMDKFGMDKDQKESVHNACKWTAAVLERIGDAIQREGLRISQDEQYRLSILMRSANNDCRRCEIISSH